MMKSKLTIEMDFSSGSPVIEIICEKSDDIRDKLVARFLELLGHESTWLKIDNNGQGSSNLSKWIIQPITPAEFATEGAKMLEQAV